MLEDDGFTVVGRIRLQLPARPALWSASPWIGQVSIDSARRQIN
jgi:hypothetical protein